MMRQLVRVFAAALSLVGPARADDNAVAYRLYAKGQYAEAAEIFTDPAWKGAAFYKSDQFWRAAEAYVRADDAISIYNLGNCYAHLGYYELALAAYLQALARQPALRDAAVNADIMRKLIAEGDDNKSQQGIQPQGREIDQVDARKDKKDGGGQQGEEKGKAEEQRASAERTMERNQASQEAQTQSDEGRSGDGARRDTREGAAGQNLVQGTKGDSDPAEQSSGGSRADSPESDDEAAGMRTRLEGEQATEQWLNRIRDEPARFLKARIALESRRREASGNLPPAGGDAW